MIEVISVKIKTTQKRVARVDIKYHDLILKCDLVVYNKENKLWIRMPEFWFTKDKKTHFCMWKDKITSDAFQQECLKQIVDKFGINIDVAKRLLLKNKNKSSNLIRQN